MCDLKSDCECRLSIESNLVQSYNTTADLVLGLDHYPNSHNTACRAIGREGASGCTGTPLSHIATLKAFSIACHSVCCESI